jgi:AbrB family looped-hinge helix DNA binding protein
MIRKYKFEFNATVSDRGQIFIPKVLQDYFKIKSRDKVSFVVLNNGKIIFKKKTKGSKI